MSTIVGRKIAKKKKRKLRIIETKTSAAAQSKQIAATVKRVDRLSTRVYRDSTRYGLYHVARSSLMGAAANVVYLQPALTVSPSGAGFSPAWGPCFEQAPSALNCTRARLGRMYVKMCFTCNTEDAPITISVFHVRLNPKNAEYIMKTNSTNFGTILGSGANEEYLVRSPSTYTTGLAENFGTPMLSPAYFIVKRSWTFTIGTQNNTAVGTSPSTVLSQTMKLINYSFPLGYTLGSGTGTWGDVSADTDTAPHLKNYLLVFSNNSLLDLAQSPSYSILSQCTATGIQ